MDKTTRNEMTTRSLINTIMGQMSRVEDRTGVMFHELDADLETRIWAAIDAKDLNSMRGLIKELDSLT